MFDPDNVRFIQRPKPRAPVPSQPMIQILSPSVQREQKNARDLSSARIVSPAEQLQREKEAKLREKQSKKLEKLKKELQKLEGIDPSSAGKPTKTVQLFRYQFHQLDGSTSPIHSASIEEDSDKVFHEIKGILLDNPLLCHVRVFQGVVLICHFGEKSEIFWYATEASAQKAAEKATDRGALSVRIDPVLQKSDLLRGLPRPTRAPLAKKQRIQIREDNYNRGTSWQKVGQTRVTFSHG